MEYKTKIFEDSLPEYNNEELDDLINNKELFSYIIKTLENNLKNLKTLKAEEIIVKFDNTPII